MVSNPIKFDLSHAPNTTDVDLTVKCEPLTNNAVKEMFTKYTKVKNDVIKSNNNEVIYRGYRY
jgi:hypothetical protein